MFKKFLVLTVLVVIAALSLGGGVSAQQNAPGTESHNLTVRAKKQIGLMVQASTNAQVFTSTAFTQLTADSILIPANGNFRAVVRFSGESDCAASGWCTLRILVNGVEANPKVGSDFAFDSPDGGPWQSLSIDRVSDVIAGTGVARNVTIEVQVALVGSGSWRLDDWTVVTELSKQ
jgi:hypothetical protein